MAHCPGGAITARPGPARDDGGNFHSRASATQWMTWGFGGLVALSLSTLMTAGCGTLVGAGLGAAGGAIYDITR